MSRSVIYCRDYACHDITVPLFWAMVSCWRRKIVFRSSRYERVSPLLVTWHWFLVSKRTANSSCLGHSVYHRYLTTVSSLPLFCLSVSLCVIDRALLQIRFSHSQRSKQNTMDGLFSFQGPYTWRNPPPPPPPPPRSLQQTFFLLRPLSNIFSNLASLRSNALLDNSVNFSSVLCSERPICAPPRLSEVSPILPLKWFQCSYFQGRSSSTSSLSASLLQAIDGVMS